MFFCQFIYSVNYILEFRVSCVGLCVTNLSFSPFSIDLNDLWKNILLRIFIPIKLWIARNFTFVEFKYFSFIPHVFVQSDSVVCPCRKLSAAWQKPSAILFDVDVKDAICFFFIILVVKENVEQTHVDRNNIYMYIHMYERIPLAPKNLTRSNGLN